MGLVRTLKLSNERLELSHLDIAASLTCINFVTSRNTKRPVTRLIWINYGDPMICQAVASMDVNLRRILNTTE